MKRLRDPLTWPQKLLDRDIRGSLNLRDRRDSWQFGAAAVKEQVKRERDGRDRASRVLHPSPKEATVAPIGRVIQHHHSLGDRLRTWRKDRGLTQARVGKKLGVSQATVSRLERGYSETVALRKRKVMRGIQTLVSDPSG